MDGYDKSIAERRHLPAHPCTRSCSPLATWEEVQELAAQLEETQEQTVQKGPVRWWPRTTGRPCPKSRGELEKEQASRETFQQQVGKEQERFTSKLSEEFSAWKNELEDFQQQTERRWRQLRRRFTLGAAALLGLGLRGIVDAAAVMENEVEDEEQRRERIQAEENGQDLGAALGIVLGLATHVVGGRGPSSPGGGALLLLCDRKGGSVDQTRNY